MFYRLVRLHDLIWWSRMPLVTRARLCQRVHERICRLVAGRE